MSTTSVQPQGINHKLIHRLEVVLAEMIDSGVEPHGSRYWLPPLMVATFGKTNTSQFFSGRVFNPDARAVLFGTLHFWEYEDLSESTMMPHYFWRHSAAAVMANRVERCSKLVACFYCGLHPGICAFKQAHTGVGCTSEVFHEASWDSDEPAHDDDDDDGTT